MNKKEIRNAASDVRKVEIDEGHKLAKQISAIRQTKADEEMSLEKFRSETLTNIKAELEPLQKELEDTKKELFDAKQTRDEWMVPLDAEWANVAIAKAETEKIREYTLEALELAQVDRKQAREELAKVENAKARVRTAEEVAHDVKNSAIIIERDASEIMEQAEIAKRESEVYQREALATIAEENRKLGLRTEALVSKEEAIAVEQAEIAIAKLRLEDRTETLKRALKRKS